MKPFVSISLALLFLSANLALAQWVPVGLTGRGIRDIAMGNNSMFAVTNDSGSVYRSTDGGMSWALVFPLGVSHVAVSPITGTVFVVKQDIDTVYRSTNNGISWLASGPSAGPWWGPHWVVNVDVSPIGTVYCCMHHRHLWTEDLLFTSTDDGGLWEILPLTGGRITSFHLEDIATLGVICDFYTTYCYWGISTNNGTSWTSSSPSWVSFFPTSLLWGNAGVFLGVTTGLFISTDTCLTWTRVSTITPTHLLSLQHGGFLACTDSDGVFLFSDNGDSLGTRNQGLTNLQVHILALDSAEYVYAGTGSGVWRRPISELATSVRPSSGDPPNQFILEQNYPNPFNPSTTISYQLPTQSHVTLKVFDLLGREVATLVDGIEQPGYKSVQWNANGVASGVYFCRMQARLSSSSAGGQAGDFVANRKLLLLR